MKKTTLLFLLVFLTMGIVLGQANSEKTLSQKLSFDKSAKVNQPEMRMKVAQSLVMTNGMVLLNESFEAGIPAGWSQSTYSGNGMWRAFTDGKRMIPQSDGKYLAADSDIDQYKMFDAGLFTNAVDMSGYGVVSIDFDRNFQDYAGIGEAHVSVYSGGVTQENFEEELWWQSTDDPAAGTHAHFLIYPGDYADPSQVYIEFYYSTDGHVDAWYFALDNLLVQGMNTGNVSGFVYNGVPANQIQGAEVGTRDLGIQTVSNAPGYYQLSNLETGMHTIYCKVPGVNIQEKEITVSAGMNAMVNFNMLAPELSVQPATVGHTLNTNEYLSTDVTLQNAGEGDAHWTAEVADGVEWLDVSQKEGVVLADSNQNLSLILNASGISSGSVLSGKVWFIVHPDVDTVTVTVTMNVEGDTLSPVTNLIANIEDLTNGKVNLGWDFDDNSSALFRYFKIERNGEQIATTSNLFYTDYLPLQDNYTYKVYPYYDAGNGTPGGPETVYWGIPQLTLQPAALSDVVWSNNYKVQKLILQNSGEGELHFEFPGFKDPDFQNAFITSVSPYEGDILSGENISVYVTFSAYGFGTGIHNTNLELITNELEPDNSHAILSTMQVTVPGAVSGTVTDCNNGEPIEGVAVTVVDQMNPEHIFTAQTLSNGTYHLNTDAGNYNVIFSKSGYNDFNATAEVAAGGNVVADGQVCVMQYPVNWVTAQVNNQNIESVIEWSVPMGSYEVMYDDGTAEEYLLLTEPGVAAAVRFTPAGYPATITGGRLYLGDGSFPADGSTIIGSSVSIGIIDDDGTGGTPGTLLDSVTITINQYGWLEFDGIFDRTIEDGDFYIAVWQLNGSDHALPVGIDAGAPVTYRSYLKQQGSDWEVSPYQDIMMRSVVRGPNQGITMNADAENLIYPVNKVFRGIIATGELLTEPGTMKAGSFKGLASENNLRGFVGYKIARVSGFDPDAGELPEDGTITILSENSSNLTFVDTIGSQPMGWYAYAVKAVYETGESGWVYSNIVGHLKDVDAVFSFYHCCVQVPENIEVTLTGKEYPYNIYYGVSAADGIVYFDSIVKGLYDFSFFKVGTQPQFYNDIRIKESYHFDNIIMLCKIYPARNLSVDPLTSIATWDEPLVTALYNQTFEGVTFPPSGWQVNSYRPEWDTAWKRTSVATGSFGDWVVPDHEGYFALVNDNIAGVSGIDGSMDYLVLPESDLRERDDYKLYFESFYDGYNGGTATVEYSTDNGETWTVLEELPASTDWEHKVIDLSSVSGSNAGPSIWIAFHYNDHGEWAGGWAVDNVEVHAGVAFYQGYVIYLDNSQIAEPDSSQTSFQYEDLVYGTPYTASLRVKNCCGLSNPVYYNWQSTYLYPPLNVRDEYIYNTNTVPVIWDLPIQGDPVTSKQMEVPEIVYQGPAEIISPASETAPEVTRFKKEEDNASRDTWDLQFAWETAHDNGEAGVESDGDYIYTSQWNGDRFTKYTLDGTWVEDFTIPGVSNVRDLAYDGHFFYGSAASTTIFIMDFDAHALLGTISAPCDVRALAYNGDRETFYANNYDTDIMEFDKNGVPKSSFSTSGLSAIYGLAYDNWSEGGPYLWAYDQGNNDLTKFSLPNGNYAGTVDVESITGTTSAAGGLFTQPDIVTGTVTISGCAQNEKVWGLELFDFNNPNVPDGLLSFNVYRDGNLMVNIPYEGEQPPYQPEFDDFPLQPGTYIYEVSALYDLTQFGYPGEIGESCFDNEDTVVVIWGHAIPFTEEWNSGNFDINYWITDSPNWVINNSTGDGAPSAEFKNMPHLVNGYESSLTSAPFRVDSLSEGSFWLDFNLKLDDMNQTGKERLSIEVFDGNGWHQVGEVANNGSFDFEEGFNHIEITRYVRGNTFNVRFKATGQNSTDIQSWYVDNINIYRTCDPPKDLEGTYVWKQGGDYGVQICWEAPSYPYFNSDWINWDKGENYSAIAACLGFSAAIRWDAGMLDEQDGDYITAVNFYTCTLGYDSLVLKVWKDTSASELVYRQDVSSKMKPNSWNMIWLQTPVEIESDKELWVGYTIYGAVAGTFTAGTDKGPAIVGYGDKIGGDGMPWDNLSDFGLSYNWNIQALVEPLNFQPEPLPLLEDDYVSCSYRSTPVLGEINENGKTASSSFNRDLESFKVYRSESGEEGSYVEYATVPYEAVRDKYCYFDHEPNVQTQTSYWYKVSAVRNSETDGCESAFANSKLMPDEDFVAVLVTDVDDPKEEEIAVYPNPASDRLMVHSSEGMKRLTLINYVGQVVYQDFLNGDNSINLNIANYDSGIYIVRIETDQRVYLNRIVIIN